MSLITRILVSVLVALATLPVSGAIAQTAQEEERIRAVLAQLRAGEKIKVATTQRNFGSTEIVAANIDVARAMAKSCSLGEYSIVKTITNKPGLSVIAVNLDCTERKRYGFMFSFQDGDLTGIELRPEGILFAPPAPPAPPSSKPNVVAPPLLVPKGFDDPRDYYRVAKYVLEVAEAGNDLVIADFAWSVAAIEFASDVLPEPNSLRLDGPHLRRVFGKCTREGQIEVDQSGATMTMNCASEKLSGKFDVSFEYRGSKILLIFVSKFGSADAEKVAPVDG